MKRQYRFLVVFFAVAICICVPGNAAAATSDGVAPGRGATVPERVVCLVPAVTEMLCAVGAGDSLVGVTSYDKYPPEVALKTVVGGYFSPSAKRIAGCNPDLVICSRLHKNIMKEARARGWRVMVIHPGSVEELYRIFETLGAIFHREKEAQQAIAVVRGEFEHVTAKVAAVPVENRLRVIRLMGRGKVMTPGDDSFQNELIRIAGGIPPKLGKNGGSVPITLEEWRAFNPQVIYGCGNDRLTAKEFFGRPGWKDVEAVQQGRIHYFPCEYTCRMSPRSGTFAASLASLLYEESFTRPELQVQNDGIVSSRPVALPLACVKDARIVYSSIHDFTNKTLRIDFLTPMTVLSTLEGQRPGITTVGNHYSSPPCWGIEHRVGLEASRRRVYETLGIVEETASLLFTGADMDNLAVKKTSFRDMEVYALVTAGVRGNAMRMGFDEGRHYEPGTINMIILTNMRLTPRAMTRAMISATEAKTAALSDMDIRSSYTPLANQATGTGTDNIIVVEGSGIPISKSGGHTKMGELIARAVYAAVGEAVYRQNGLVAGRSVIHRLRERNIDLATIAGNSEETARLEELLLTPRYAAFVSAALAVSDGYVRGLSRDHGLFEQWCRLVAADVAGVPVSLPECSRGDSMPPVLRLALESLVQGLRHQPGAVLSVPSDVRKECGCICQ